MVENGIAQLANYEEYFNFEKNREFGLAKYSIKISDPKLILIVGSYENASREELDEASRKIEIELCDH